MSVRHPHMIIGCVATLMLTGLTMIYSNTAVRCGANPFDNGPLCRHALYVLLSAAAMAVFAFVDYHLLARYGRRGILLIVLALALLLLVAKPVNGARRWFHIGPMNLQVSELAKIVMIVYVAGFVSRKRERIGDFKQGLLPALVVLGGLFVLILLEPDFGTAVLVATVGMVMLICGGARWRHVLPLFAAAGPVLFLLVRMREYRWQRLIAFLNPWADPQGVGHQVVQSLIALGCGGVTGVGPGRGLQQLGFLPEPDTDFVFAIFGQETGFIGCLLLLIVFVALVYAGMEICHAAPDVLGAMIALGVTVLIGIQVFINIAVATSAIPTKGIALPFVSRGGSALLALSIGGGLLLNVARHCPRGGARTTRGATRRPSGVDG
ncbi:MAG: putative peptidoglycan glycosyltransferase FtsW [Planctomycetota bacterium]